MKITSKSLTVVILVVLFGGIALTSSLNWWRTESNKVPARITRGEMAGAYDPADIRGSYTFGDINASFQVPLGVLKTAFGLPEGVVADSYQVKNLESAYADIGDEVEIGTASVRYFVALYTGLPYEPTEEVFLLQPAVEILMARGGLESRAQEYLESHTIALSGETAGQATGPTTGAPANGETHAEGERMVRGMTTIQEVLDWGVPAEDIEGILGDDLPARNTVIRSYCQEKGLEFSPIKAALQAELDAMAE